MEATILKQDLTLAEAAAELRIGREALRQSCLAGAVRHYRVGRRGLFRVPAAEVARIKSNEPLPVEAPAHAHG